MIQTYNLEEMRHLEERLSRPLDIEREMHEQAQFRFIVGGGRVLKFQRPASDRIRADWPLGAPTNLIYANQNIGTAKNTFTTEALINDVAGMGPQAKIRADFWDSSPFAIAKTLRVVARGIFGSTGTPTFTFNIRLGASGVAGPIGLGTGALTTLTTITNKLWELEGDIVMVTPAGAGANSTIRGIGHIRSGQGLSAPGIYEAWGGNAQPGTVATVDTTIVNFINMTAACSASNVLNTIQVLQLLVVGLN
jgi:hypothetical protein